MNIIERPEVVFDSITGVNSLNLTQKINECIADGTQKPPPVPDWSTAS
jgi:hypothetical protein